MELSSYILAFTSGLFGGFHCIGMCSGINGGFFAAHGGAPTLKPVLFFHLARIGVYMLLGISGAVLGRTLVQVGMVGKSQGLLMMVSGVLLILMGMYMAFTVWQKAQLKNNCNWKPIVFSPYAVHKKPPAPWVAGLLNGLVPCSLVFSVAIKATGTADPFRAGLLMLSFGLGTLPVMALLSATGAQLGNLQARSIRMVVSLLVIVLGLWTFYEGLIFYDVMRGLSN